MLKGVSVILNGFRRILRDLAEMLKGGGWKGLDGV